LLQGLLLLGLFLPSLTVANEATGVLQISLRVVASCDVQTRSLVFATYKAGGPAVGTASPGAIDVSCTKGTSAAVYLDGDRTLAGPGSARVSYVLQANGQSWPAGAPIAVRGRGAQPIRLQLSGSVPAGQGVVPGDYADAAVVRVVY
jgi:spore coat protein U-like protein